MVKTRILVVDDEPSIIKYLRANLEASGYEVLAAMDGTEGLQTFERELPDLILLDVRMPKMDGFEVCRRIRDWSKIPIIMLTSLGSVEDKVKAFDLGADDYITKPFGKAEVMARVKAVLRRTTLWDERPEPEFHAHNLAINFTRNRVTLGEQEVNLTATEYRLLSYLARNAGRVVTPDQILEAVWGRDYAGERHILRVNIGRLRQKLGDNSREPRFITTRTGIGYMFLKPD
jgi:DNA-binding response OmpR family regulator